MSKLLSVLRTIKSFQSSQSTYTIDIADIEFKSLIESFEEEKPRFGNNQKRKRPKVKLDFEYRAERYRDKKFLPEKGSKILPLAQNILTQ